MKVYMVYDPEQLREIAPMMKWQSDKLHVEDFARVWASTRKKDPDKAARLAVRIEIGRSAQMYRLQGDRVAFLGTISLPQARTYFADKQAE